MPTTSRPRDEEPSSELVRPGEDVDPDEEGGEESAETELIRRENLPRRGHRPQR